MTTSCLSDDVNCLAPIKIIERIKKQVLGTSHIACCTDNDSSNQTSKQIIVVNCPAFLKFKVITFEIVCVQYTHYFKLKLWLFFNNLPLPLLGLQCQYMQMNVKVIDK